MICLPLMIIIDAWCPCWLLLLFISYADYYFSIIVLADYAAAIEFVLMSVYFAWYAICAWCADMFTLWCFTMMRRSVWLLFTIYFFADIDAIVADADYFSMMPLFDVILWWYFSMSLPPRCRWLLLIICCLIIRWCRYAAIDVYFTCPVISLIFRLLMMPCLLRDYWCCWLRWCCFFTFIIDDDIIIVILLLLRFAFDAVVCLFFFFVCLSFFDALFMPDALFRRFADAWWYFLLMMIRFDIVVCCRLMMITLMITPRHYYWRYLLFSIAPTILPDGERLFFRHIPIRHVDMFFFFFTRYSFIFRCLFSLILFHIIKIISLFDIAAFKFDAWYAMPFSMMLRYFIADDARRCRYVDAFDVWWCRLLFDAAIDADDDVWCRCFDVLSMLIIRCKECPPYSMFITTLICWLFFFRLRWWCPLMSDAECASAAPDAWLLFHALLLPIFDRRFFRCPYLLFWCIFSDIDYAIFFHYFCPCLFFIDAAILMITRLLLFSVSMLLLFHAIICLLMPDYYVLPDAFSMPHIRCLISRWFSMPPCRPTFTMILSLRWLLIDAMPRRY